MSRVRKLGVVQAEEVRVPLSSLSLGRHECPVPDCPERFTSVGDKKRHMRTSHGKASR